MKKLCFLVTIAFFAMMMTSCNEHEAYINKNAVIDGHEVQVTAHVFYSLKKGQTHEMALSLLDAAFEADVNEAIDDALIRGIVEPELDIENLLRSDVNIEAVRLF